MKMKITILLLLASISCGAFAAESYQKQVFKDQNQLRNKHNTANLDLDDGLTFKAENCATAYLNGLESHKCINKTLDIGENICQCSGHTLKACASSSIAKWYAENAVYDYDKGTSVGGNTTGHFTQVVWRSSKKFGFGCSIKSSTTVCVGLYQPSGNYIGEYTKNVLRPIK